MNQNDQAHLTHEEMLDTIARIDITDLTSMLNDFVESLDDEMRRADTVIYSKYGVEVVGVESTIIDGRSVELVHPNDPQNDKPKNPLPPATKLKMLDEIIEQYDRQTRKTLVNITDPNTLNSAIYEVVQARITLSKNYDIIRSEMAEVEPNINRDTSPVELTGSTVELPQNPNVACLPWTPDSTPEEIGRTAVAAVQAIQTERQLLQDRLTNLRDQEQAIVLAAKDAGRFSWAGLARAFGRHKGYMTTHYDPNSIATSRQRALNSQRRLREDAAKARQQAS